MTSGPAPAELITEDWRLHGSIYTSPELFVREQQQVFHGPWLYVAHESEVREPGDYKTTYAGVQPVIVARGADDGQIRVLLNRCRHRGSAVCHEDAGNASYFRCPYHGWTYRNSGELRGITYDDAYGDIDRSKLGLVHMPRVESFAGFVFASFAPEGPSLEEYLGNAAPYLQIVSEQGPNGVRLSAGAHKLQYRNNWKLQIENTIDNYHFGFVHRSFLDVLADRIGQAPPIMHNVMNNPEWRTLDLGNGHSVHEFGDPHTGNNQGQLGDLPFNLIVFPNLCFVGAQLRHVLPKAANRTEVRLYPLLHEGDSDDDNAAILRVHEGFYGPAGMGGADDIEVAFERVGDGLQAVEHDWIIMSRGMDREQPGENGTLVGHAADELPQRAFYRRWKALMEEAALSPEEFLYHEAALLDERRLDEWLELYTEDALYWIPQGEEADPRLSVSIAYDDRRRLHERVLRLSSGFAYSQDPPSRTTHVVGNVRVVGEAGDETEVRSTLIVVEVRRNVQSLYAGQVEHTLVSAGDGFQIRRKVVRLMNSDVPLGNVTFLI